MRLELLGANESIPWHAPVSVGAVPTAAAVAIPVWTI